MPNTRDGSGGTGGGWAGVDGGASSHTGGKDGSPTVAGTGGSLDQRDSEALSDLGQDSAPAADLGPELRPRLPRYTIVELTVPTPASYGAAASAASAQV